jgi:hypothetical protein
VCLSIVLAGPLLGGAVRAVWAAPPKAQEPLPFSPRPAPVVQWPAVADGLSSSEQAVARRLFDRLAKGVALRAADADAALSLVASHAASRSIGSLAVSVLMGLAYQEATARDCDAALEHLRSARALDEEGAYIPLATLDVLLQCGAWTEAEVSARDLLARRPENDEAALGLAYALLRQDRDQEALDALDASPRLRDHPLAIRLRERLAKNLAVEAGFREQRLSHFNLRYDGERHEAIGERVLDTLERHFGTLTSAFDYQPQMPIPVILLTREAYFDSMSAPRWSGGEFSEYDGRVRVPILGLTADRVRELESTLLHELTHAFVYELTRGAANRDLQEGLAQYMEGKRTTTMATPDKVAVATGRVEGVRLKYLAALSFVEFLMSQGDQAAMNLLLTQLGKVGDVDAAWREAYGRTLAELRVAWLETLRPGSP